MFQYFEHLLSSFPGGVVVKELAGGCEDSKMMPCSHAPHIPIHPSTHAPLAKPILPVPLFLLGLCCTLSGPMGAAIAQLIRNVKPDRLIIEPSGLGHPAGGGPAWNKPIAYFERSLFYSLCYCLI